MSEIRLTIGNRNTSSRSLAVWLVLRRAGMTFELRVLDLRDGAGLEEAGRISPSGRLPVLEIGELRISEPLAICEYVAEQRPGLWPEVPELRARARAVAAEAIYELPDLLTFLPMDMTGRFTPPGKLLRGVQRDLDRLRALWESCLADAPAGGPFLFGRFSVADAFMAPIVSRLETHGIALGEVADAYIRAICGLPEYGEWAGLAERELAAAEAPSPAPRREGRAAATVPRPPPSPPKPPPPAPAGGEPEPAAPKPAASRPLTGADRLFGRGRSGRAAGTGPASGTAAAPSRSVRPPAATREVAPKEVGREAETRRPAAAGDREPASPPPAGGKSSETAAEPEVSPPEKPAKPAAPPSPEPVRRQRPRPAPTGPIVKPIGAGIRRRR